MNTENTTESVNLEKMEQRQIFDNIESCLPVLKTYQDACDESVEVVVQGANSDGTISTALYNPKIMQTVLYRLTRQMPVNVEEDGKTVVKRQARTVAIIVNPIPRIDVLGSTEAGRAYLAHLCATEFQHRISRPFRDEQSNLAAVATEAPHTIEQFIEGSKKDGAGSLVAAFNEAFKAMNTELKNAAPAYKKAKITKADLRHALQCTAFATHGFSHLEEEGLFVIIGRVFAKWAQDNGHNPAIFATWEKTRDTVAFAIPTAGEGFTALESLLGDFGNSDDDVDDDSDSDSEAAE